MILDKFKLDGKVAIVTGASRGLGQAIAIALAEAGADLALVARGDLSVTRQEIETLGSHCIGITADLASSDCVDRIVTTVVDELGAIDVLVNNAGTTRRAPIMEYTAQDWDDVLTVNLRTLFLLSQAAARVFIRQGGGGKIVNIASLLSFQGGILCPAYAAAKSGVVALTKSMSNELARENINVNAIAPGYFETDLTADLKADPERNKSILDRIPAGRWGQPGDLAGAAVFLASEASSYMHGYTIAVDGGWLAR